ncbi:MAG: hydroxysqualene dehydroxylase HpnE [Candidatus Dormibacteria bacterium]
MSDQRPGLETVVIGGGLAGISAALHLADRGHRVRLLERAPALGGLCRSVPDPTMGRVDTGQHVYLGCCTQLELLLARLGVVPSLRQRRLELMVVDPATAETRLLRAAPLPPPLHLLPMLARWPGLPRGQVAGARRVLSNLRSGSSNRLDDVPALSWLESLGQSPAVIRAVWEPLLVAACNLDLASCSAAAAAQVIREGLLGSARGAALRVPGTDLTSWLGPPSERALTRAGVEVRLRVRAQGVSRGADGRLQVADGQGSSLSADRVVLATRAAHALGLLRRGGLNDPGLERAAELPDSPIVNVHLFTDRPFLPHPIVVVPRSPLQWLFDRSALSPEEGLMEGIHHSAISISAAEDEIGVAEDRLTKTMWELCRSTFPAASRARLIGSRVTREAHATFAPVTGSSRLRPGPVTTVPGVVVAGSWTATGWPATMEGAVRSGAAAATAA